MIRYRGIGLFVVLATVWGSTFTAIKAGLEFFPSVLSTALRYDVTGVVMLAYALYVTDSPPPRGRAEWAEVTIGAVSLIATYHALLSTGETDPTMTSVAAVVTASFSPVLIARFARPPLLNKRLALLGVIDLPLGFINVAVLSELDSNNLLTGGTVAKPLIFGAVAASALGSVLIHRVDSELPIETMEAWSMLLDAGLMHVVSAGLGEHPGAVILNVQSVAAFAYLSLATSALGSLVYFDPLTRPDPIEISLVSCIAPVFVALSGWAFLSGVPTSPTAGGFALIFLGFAPLRRGAIRRELRY